MKKITINSKDYNLDKVIGFNEMCELEDLGLSVATFDKSRFTTFRALFAWFGDMDAEEAGNEILAHLKNGGTIKDLSPLIDAFIESDFFQTTQQSVEKASNATSKE